MLRLSLLFVIAATLQLNAQVLEQQSAIEKALAYHPDIKRFILQVSSTQEGVKIARADYLPQVMFNAEYDPQRTYVLPQNGQFNTVDGDGWQAGAFVNQKIWDFSKTTSAIDASKQETKIAELSLTDAKALLAYKVKLQYALMVVQKKAIDVRQKDMEAKEELYKQAQAMVKQGMKTRADATRFLSALYLAKDNLGIAKAAYQKARSTLSIYIGEPIDEDVTLEENILYQDEMDFGNEGGVYSVIEAQNPQLQSAKESVYKNELLYKSAQASHYGSINAMASYNYQDTLNSYDTTIVGITFSVPLYIGGRISAQAQQAQLAEASAKEAYHAKALALQEEVQNLLIDLKRYDNTIAAKKAQLEASQETKTLLNARYKEGLSTYIEVLDATALYLNAELGLLEAYYTKSAIIDRIDYLQGKST